MDLDQLVSSKAGLSIGKGLLFAFIRSPLEKYKFCCIFISLFFDMDSGRKQSKYPQSSILGEIKQYSRYLECGASPHHPPGTKCLCCSLSVSTCPCCCQAIDNIPISQTAESFNAWRGDVASFSPFWEGTAQKQPLPEINLTNPLVKRVEFGASLPIM